MLLCVSLGVLCGDGTYHDGFCHAFHQACVLSFPKSVQQVHKIRVPLSAIQFSSDSMDKLLCNQISTLNGELDGAVLQTPKLVQPEMRLLDERNQA